MVETGVGAPRKAQEIGLVEAACGEGREQASRQRRVVEAAHAPEFRRRECGPDLGHEQAAVLGQAGEEHLLVASPAALAAGTDVGYHQFSVWLAGLRPDPGKAQGGSTARTGHGQSAGTPPYRPAPAQW